jgi:putative membrane protein
MATGKIDKGLQERLERLHAMNQAEVQMGQIGAQSAQSPDVKQFAEHMQTDHEKADQKLTQTAQTAGAASLEGDTFRKESDKHKEMRSSVEDRDRLRQGYMSRMVKDHER